MCHPEGRSNCVFPPPVQRHSAALYESGNDKSPKHYVWEEDEKQRKSAPSHSVYSSLPLLLITRVGFKSLLCVKNLQGCWQTPSSSTATHPNPPAPPPTQKKHIHYFFPMSVAVISAQWCSGRQNKQGSILENWAESVWSLHVLPASPWVLCRFSGFLKQIGTPSMIKMYISS